MEEERSARSISAPLPPKLEPDAVSTAVVTRKCARSKAAAPLLLKRVVSVASMVHAEPARLKDLHICIAANTAVQAVLRGGLHPSKAHGFRAAPRLHGTVIDTRARVNIQSFRSQNATTATSRRAPPVNCDRVDFVGLKIEMATCTTPYPS